METTDSRTEVLSVKDWLITLLISAIPLVNIVMLIIWAFGDSTNINKANWSKATLILIGIMIALYFVFFILFFGAFMGSTTNF